MKLMTSILSVCILVCLSGLAFNAVPERQPERAFVKEAASNGQLEVQLANLALERAQSSQVKDLAQMIRDDHRQANQQLQEIATQNNWEFAQGEPDRQTLSTLSAAAPEEFDQVYVRMMIQSHQRAIEQFRMMTKQPKKPDDHSFTDDAGPVIDGTEPIHDDKGINELLLDWINSTLPALQKHLNRSLELAEQQPNLNAK